jgi:hypothetical protein
MKQGPQAANSRETPRGRVGEDALGPIGCAP